MSEIKFYAPGGVVLGASPCTNEDNPELHTLVSLGVEKGYICLDCRREFPMGAHFQYKIDKDNNFYQGKKS